MLCVYLLESPFASSTGAIINPQWPELPMSRTNFHGPKDVRAIEVRLYIYYITYHLNEGSCVCIYVLSTHIWSLASMQCLKYKKLIQLIF